MTIAEPETVTLREYIDAILAEREKALGIAFAAQKEALEIASHTLELRLEKLNELRQEVTSDRGNFITREKYESDVHTKQLEKLALIEKHNAALEVIQKWQNQMEGTLIFLRWVSGSGVIALGLTLLRLGGIIR